MNVGGVDEEKESIEALKEARRAGQRGDQIVAQPQAESGALPSGPSSGEILGQLETAAALPQPKGDGLIDPRIECAEDLRKPKQPVW